MAIAPPSDASLVRYLLGTADRDAEERFDELSVTDTAFAERLRAIEHDLADSYVRGELSPSDRERWEARYLASPHGRDDLALAQALAARDAEAGGRRSGAVVVGRVFRPGRTLGTWWPLAAAAALVLAVIGGYRIAHRERPPATIAQQSPVVTPAPAPTAPAAHVVALTLMPSVRSIDPPPTLAIPPGTTEVKLTLRLEPGARDRFDVALRELATNGAAWRADALTASGDDPNRALLVTIPAATFRSGRYLINVSAGSSSSREILATYTFLVVLQ